MARFVCLGDAHLGRTHLAHLRDEEGRNLREEDFLRSFSWAVETTVGLEPDGFLWLGDIFDHARPSYRTFAHVLAGLQRLADAELPGVAISGNHDTPRLRGIGSPYDALERIFPNVTFAWRMEAVRAEVAGAEIHAVPQTLTQEEFRSELDQAARNLRGDAPSVLLAHVALTSLPVRQWRDINELEVDEAAFDRRFDLVLLGHYHVHQKVSKRTWYAGATDSFNFGDRPAGAGPKGIVVLDTDTGKVQHHANPHERPLLTVGVEAGGLSPSELLEATAAEASSEPSGSIVRVFLNHVDPAAFRQLGPDDFRDVVPGALHVQVNPDFDAGALPVQGGPEIGTLEAEWERFVALQDLAGLERDRLVTLGRRFLEEANGEAG